MTRPIRIVWFWRHSGHHALGATAPAPRAGAAMPIAIALISTNADQDARAQRQSSLASGSTPTGVVRAVGSVSPIRMPLL